MYKVLHDPGPKPGFVFMGAGCLEVARFSVAVIGLFRDE
jgi:hypothetical protein